MSYFCFVTFFRHLELLNSYASLFSLYDLGAIISIFVSIAVHMDKPLNFPSTGLLFILSPCCIASVRILMVINSSSYLDWDNSVAGWPTDDRYRLEEKRPFKIGPDIVRTYIRRLDHFVLL